MWSALPYCPNRERNDLFAEKSQAFWDTLPKTPDFSLCAAKALPQATASGGRYPNILPPQATTSPVYTTSAWPGVTARWGSRNHTRSFPSPSRMASPSAIP